jgi:hypothetical protein
LTLNRCSLILSFPIQFEVREYVESWQLPALTLHLSEGWESK